MAPLDSRSVYRPALRSHPLAQVQLDAGVLKLLARGVEVEDLIRTRQQPARRLAQAVHRMAVPRK